MYLAMYPTHPSAAGQNAIVSYMINKNFQKVNAGIHAHRIQQHHVHTKQAGAGPVETPLLHLHQATPASASIPCGCLQFPAGSFFLRLCHMIVDAAARRQLLRRADLGRATARQDDDLIRLRDRPHPMRDDDDRLVLDQT